MDPLDAYRTANLLIQHYGEDAKIQAAARVRDMRTRGDAKGEWAWMGVLDAVLVLEATQPAEGQALH
jgi:hypothetical protein